MQKEQKIWTKTELSTAVWNRVERILKERGISQVQLRDMCLQRGYKISQPEISKLFAGKVSVSLYQAIAFSEILNISMDYLIKGANQHRRFIVEGDMFIKEPSNDAFKGFLGSFHSVFYSTSPFEEGKILRGLMQFIPSEDGSICEAMFALDTGEKDTNEQFCVKYYRGQFLISKLGVAYCILANEKMGEVSMVEFRHRSFFIKEVECLMGLALTTTTGGKRYPTVHRMLLSRHKIPDDKLNQVMPYLKLTRENEFIIRKKDIEMLSSELEMFDYDKIKSTIDSDEYLIFDQRMLPFMNKKLSRPQIAEIIGTLKNLSYESYSNVLSEADDDILFDRLRCGINEE